MKNIAKVGIMGGTFDPIHIGHLIIANEVIDTFKLDKIIFIPTGVPAHKQDINLINTVDRYTMTELAILDNPNFLIDDIEIKREGLSYTYDTILTLREKYEDIYFIVGYDSILSILTWYKGQKLLRLCKFIVVSRPNLNTDSIKKQIKHLRKNYNADIFSIENVGFDISSTNIRNRVFANKSIKYMVPKNVCEYIYKNELYANKLTLDKTEIEKTYSLVKSKLSAKRYAHTRGVVDMGLRLAKMHAVDMNKVFLGCIFHDYAKEVTDYSKYNIEFDEFEQKNPHLWHGKIAAEIIKDLYNITDEEILNSIRYHTTGRCDMSDVEKVVYLADMIEYGRGMSEELDELREICYSDLNKGMYYGLKLTKYFVEDLKKREVHPKLDSIMEQYKKYI
ncbi:MAG: nicotinate (nicotinamide) nucleotide adenylyltransferase [Epulopiscium sp. Nuni2H_MBin003]|nr:MAG: nicotinate (nicotinamide) nucleotide adenylyltransferase [Epulopiscium sp. Nuni2H_MBin003]